MNITLHYTPNNNHGCSGFQVTIHILSDTEGQVISGSSCSSCWQVGHDNPRSPIPKDQFVRLPEGWTWEEAGEEDDESTRTDISLIERTRLGPNDLKQIEQEELQPSRAKIKALENEVQELKDKIARRNKQIRDLRLSLRQENKLR